MIKLLLMIWKSKSHQSILWNKKVKKLRVILLSHKQLLKSILYQALTSLRKRMQLSVALLSPSGNQKTPHKKLLISCKVTLSYLRNNLRCWRQYSMMISSLKLSKSFWMKIKSILLTLMKGLTRSNWPKMLLLKNKLRNKKKRLLSKLWSSMKRLIPSKSLKIFTQPSQQLKESMTKITSLEPAINSLQLLK